jgi:hypothetical protein
LLSICFVPPPPPQGGGRREGGGGRGVKALTENRRKYSTQGGHAPAAGAAFPSTVLTVLTAWRRGQAEPNHHFGKSTTMKTR